MEKPKLKEELSFLLNNETKPSFDPEQDMPITDEQVEIALRHGKADISRPLIGLYYCRRNQGDSLTEAYRTALLAALEAITK